MDSKQIFTTKTFWLNLGIVAVTAGVKYIGDMHLDPMISVGIAALLNFLNRFQTSTAAHL